MGERPVARSGGTTGDSAVSICWRTGVRSSPADDDRATLEPARDMNVGRRSAIAVALGLATLAGALALATMLASPIPFVANQSLSASDRASVSFSGALAAPVPASASVRDRLRPQARASDLAPQATASSRPAVGAADAGTAAVGDEAGANYWRSLVSSAQHDPRALLLATAFQRRMAPSVATRRSPIGLPSKEG